MSSSHMMALLVSKDELTRLWRLVEEDDISKASAGIMSFKDCESHLFQKMDKLLQMWIGEVE